MTKVASRPMMTITTISSTRGKPAAAGRPPTPLSRLGGRGGDHLQGKWWGEGAAAGRWQCGRKCIFMWIPEGIQPRTSELNCRIGSRIDSTITATIDRKRDV